MQAPYEMIRPHSDCAHDGLINFYLDLRVFCCSHAIAYLVGKKCIVQYYYKRFNTRLSSSI